MAVSYLMQRQKPKKTATIKTRKTTGLKCFTDKYHNDSLICGA